MAGSSGIKWPGAHLPCGPAVLSSQSWALGLEALCPRVPQSCSLLTIEVP